MVHVTNLNDNGAGSLRAAVQGSTKKTVVFDVAGVIALNSDLVIGDNTTIAGQTAPYPGITIRYRTVRPGSNNIIRFIRIRRGQERDVNDGADAIWQRQKNSIMLDHCSFSWCIDEVASFYDNNNFTMQWCTIAESLTNAGHNKGAHGYGGIWGGKLASFHHNFLLHMQNRVPRFNGARYQWNGYKNNTMYDVYQWENYVQAEIVDFRNCVLGRSRRRTNQHGEQLLQIRSCHHPQDKNHPSDCWSIRQFHPSGVDRYDQPLLHQWQLCLCCT